MSQGSNPFEGLPFFGDLLKMLGTQGPVQWDGARQLALSAVRRNEKSDPVAAITLVLESIGEEADGSDLLMATGGALALDTLKEHRQMTRDGEESELMDMLIIYSFQDAFTPFDVIAPTVPVEKGAPHDH